MTESNTNADPPRTLGALRHVVTLLDQTLRAFQDARSVASEDGTPLPESIDDAIMAHLVAADALVRTQASLSAVRARRRPNVELQVVPAPSDGDPQ